MRGNMALHSRNPLFGLLLFLLLNTTAVLANVEKVIFTGPAPANIPLAKPTLSDLKLHALTPENSSVRTNLSRVFPAAKGNAAQGHPAWLLLDGLTEGQRYELRVCWAAIVSPSRTWSVHTFDGRAILAHASTFRNQQASPWMSTSWTLFGRLRSSYSP